MSQHIVNGYCVILTTGQDGYYIATVMRRVAAVLAPKDSEQAQGKTIEAHFLAVVQESGDEAVFLDWRREAEKRGAL